MSSITSPDRLEGFFNTTLINISNMYALGVSLGVNAIRLISYDGDDELDPLSEKDKDEYIKDQITIGDYYVMNDLIKLGKEDEKNINNETVKHLLKVYFPEIADHQIDNVIRSYIIKHGDLHSAMKNTVNEFFKEFRTLFIVYVKDLQKEKKNDMTEVAFLKAMFISKFSDYDYTCMFFDGFLLNVTSFKSEVNRLIDFSKFD